MCLTSTRSRLLRSFLISSSLALLVGFTSAQDVGRAEPIDDGMPRLPHGAKPSNFRELKELLAPLGFEIFRPEIQPTDGTTRKLDITYSVRGDQALKLDVFMPAPQVQDSSPAVLLIHGGGWRKGDKSKEHNKAIWLANRGFVAIAVQYRLADDHPFPAALLDCREAVRFVRGHAGEYGIDPERVAIVGGSAGAHLAALLATTPDQAAFNRAIESENDVEQTSTSVDAAIVIAGPTDTTNEQAIANSRKPDSNYRVFLGGTYDEVPKRYTLISPTHWASSESPPMLIFGEKSLRSSESFEAKLKQLNVRCDTFVLRGGLHGEWNWEPWFSITMNRIDEFLRSIWDLPNDS